MYSGNRFLQLLLQPENTALVTVRAEVTETVFASFHITAEVLFQPDELIIESLLHTHADLQFTQDSVTRHFHGQVSQVIRQEKTTDNMQHAILLLTPDTEQLKHSSNCAIYDKLSLKALIQKLLTPCQNMKTDASKLDTSIKQDYWIQYNESDFEFLHRILAQHGVYYYYTHSESEHTMVFAMQSSLSKSCTEQCTFHVDGFSGQHIDSWEESLSLASTKFSGNNYDPAQATTELASNISNSNNPLKLADYHYPASYNSKTLGQQWCKLQQDSQLWQHELITASSNIPSLQSGYKLSWASGDNNPHGEYFMVSVTHSFHEDNYSSAENTEVLPYSNSFSCINSLTTYKPAIPTSPRIDGVQTAVVTGSKAGDIHQQQDHQVQVRFFWQQQSNPNSQKLWLRVNPQMASKQFGWQFLPRIGTEVLVKFRNGDPRHPEVVGSLYNSVQAMPFEPGKQPYNSGIKTLTLNSDNLNDGHQLMLDDTPKNSQVVLHSSKQLKLSTKKEATTTVAKDHTQTVVDAVSNSSQKSYQHAAKKSIVLHAGSSTITLKPGSITLKAAQVKAN